MSNVALSALVVGGSTQIFELWDVEKLQCLIIHSVVKAGRGQGNGNRQPLTYTLFMRTKTEEVANWFCGIKTMKTKTP
jgi:hypothetical protein